MSYDLAVWEGTRPATAREAAAGCAALLDRMEAEVEAGGAPPSPRIREYVEALLERWPDITADDGEESPWADGPLIGNASGNAIYFSMVWSQAEAASAFAAQIAEQQGLVCYDPQLEILRPWRHGDGDPEPAAHRPVRAFLRGLFTRQRTSRLSD